MSRWKYAYSVQSPDDPGKTRDVGISEKDLKFLYEHGHKEKLARARLVDEVFQDPVRILTIIRGWGRDKDECVIYVTSPGHDYRSDSIETPSQPNRLFLIFVMPDGTIDDWNWRDIGNDGRPEGVGGKIIWQQN
jgi:hypothetical protein